MKLAALALPTYNQLTHPHNTPNLQRLLACHAPKKPLKPLKPLNDAHSNYPISLISTFLICSSQKQNNLPYSMSIFRPHVLSMYSTSKSFDVLAFDELKFDVKSNLFENKQTRRIQFDIKKLVLNSTFCNSTLNCNILNS